MLYSVLHIAPHLGGGVGQVLLNYFAFDKRSTHTVATLDYANERAVEWCARNRIPLYSSMHKNVDTLLELAARADVVLVHFWNHPLLFDFVVNHSLPVSRLVFWAHISGLEPPYVFTEKLLCYPDRFVFTTPISFSAQEVERLEDKSRLSSILSTGGTGDYLDLPMKAHKKFTIGYVGTVDYAKMHPEYISVHKLIEDARVIVVGGGDDAAIRKSADERFVFTGQVSDIRPYLAAMDVFGYLLNEKHYGTAEQVLQEAMAAGVVPVVLNNPVERSLVRHGETGLVSASLEEYVLNIKLLRDDRAYRKKLSKQAKDYARQAFSIEAMCREWQKIYDALMLLPKAEHRYASRYFSPYDLFLESLGEHKKLFSGEQNSIRQVLGRAEWRSSTKATPRQYLAFFPEDQNLAALCELYEN